MKNRFYKCFLSFLLLIVLSNFVLADGGYFPRPGYWITPGQQRAVIFYEDNTESMILTSGFMGNAKDLAWIVPTPTKPEVTKANEKVFTNAQKLAYPKYSGSYSFGEVMKVASSGIDKGSGVVVVDSKQVDYYDVKVLVATSPEDLVKWFNDNDYSYPEEYSYVLKSYIDRGWYFTAIKISPEASGATEVIQDLKEGNPTPIKMVFLSDKIVFPLKISSVEFKNNDDIKYSAAKDEPIGATRPDNKGFAWTKVSNITGGGNWKIVNDVPYGYEGLSWGDSLIDQQPGGINYNKNNNNNKDKYGNYVPINLYIFADAKYEADNFHINYGNWVTKKDIEKLGDDEKGDSYIKPKNGKYFLTHLSTGMQKSQMDEDLYFKKANNNKKVNAGPEAWEIVIYGLLIAVLIFVVWIFSPMGILFIVGIFILFLAKNKGIRTFAWIIEIISFILTLILGLLILALGLINNSIGNYVVQSILYSVLAILIIMCVFIMLEKRYSVKK